MKSQGGLSLIELLIGITVAAVAGSLILNLLVSSNNIFYHQTVEINQGLSLNQAEKEITDTIRLSAGTENQYPSSGQADYTTGTETLILKIPSVDANNQVVDSVFDYAIITRDSSEPKILRKYLFPSGQSVRKSENKVLATSLADVEFSYLDSGNNSVSPAQSVRIGFLLNLLESASLTNRESSGSGTVNLKNI